MVARITDLDALLRELGIVPDRNGFIQCPWHEDKTPSCKIDLGPQGSVRIHCFACDKTWDGYSLIQKIRGVSFAEAVRGAASFGSTSEPHDPIQVQRAQKGNPPNIESFWDACMPAKDSPLARRYLRARAIDPTRVTMGRLPGPAGRPCRHLARFAYPSTPRPPWARSRAGTWQDTGHALILPMWNHRGRLCSLRARAIDPKTEPKVLPPRGFQQGGLVLASYPVERWHSFPSKRFVVVEGETDYLTMATHPNRDTWVTIGVISGSWTKQIASCIPDDSAIMIWTDTDATGDRYAQIIMSTLGHRCRVTRK